MKKLTLIYTFCLLASVTLLAQKNNKDNSARDKAVQSDRIVLISTSLGDMTVKLYNATPKHRDNFIKLAKENFYDSLLFHRVISNFMIQGGDPLSKHAAPGDQLGNGDNGYTIPAEFVDTVFHRKGALCAARTDNPEKASSGCQFYIVQGQVLTNEQVSMMEQQRGIKLNDKQKQVYTTVGGSPWLDGGYTVFGEVTNGLDVIDKIGSVKTAPGDRPLQNVYILKVTVLK